MLNVHSIESLGTFDGPGIRLVFFLQGCNFKCLYCANPDTIAFEGGNPYATEDLVAMARRQQPFFGKKGGITVSGGEPLIQAKGLIELFKALKEAGFHTCIDTNGSLLNDDVKELLDYTDLVLLDIKQAQEERHRKLTGRSNARTLAFADYLAQRGKATWIRYVLVPGYSDAEEDLHALGQRIKDMHNVEKLEIQPYHKLGVHKYASLGWEYALSDVPANKAEALLKAKALFQAYVPEVVIN